MICLELDNIQSFITCKIFIKLKITDKKLDYIGSSRVRFLDRSRDLSLNFNVDEETVNKETTSHRAVIR